jgi:hypothetical protein
MGNAARTSIPSSNLRQTPVHPYLVHQKDYLVHQKDYLVHQKDYPRFSRRTTLVHQRTYLVYQEDWKGWI